MEEISEKKEQYKCPGDCIKCPAVQRQYCASQNVYHCLHMLQALQDEVDTLSKSMEDLKDKLNSIQDNEASVFIPSMEEEVEEVIVEEETPKVNQTITQKVSGV